jgi:hypothetical protein
MAEVYLYLSFYRRAKMIIALKKTFYLAKFAIE